MDKFNEGGIEQVIIELLVKNGYTYINGYDINRLNTDIVLEDDLFNALYSINPSISVEEIDDIIRLVKTFNSNNIYENNKYFHELLVNGICTARLIDFDCISNNIFRVVNQFEIKERDNVCRPDVIVFVNGLPLVVMELNNTENQDRTVLNAYNQLTVRYKSDIPSLFYYNAFIVISDGINNLYGSFFSQIEQFNTWHHEGINSLFSLINGLFNPSTFLEIIKNFIIFPENTDTKIITGYPQV